MSGEHCPIASDFDSPEALWEDGDTDFPLRAKHSVISYSLYTDQLVVHHFLQNVY